MKGFDRKRYLRWFGGGAGAVVADSTSVPFPFVQDGCPPSPHRSHNGGILKDLCKVPSVSVQSVFMAAILQSTEGAVTLLKMDTETIHLIHPENGAAGATKLAFGDTAYCLCDG